MNTTTRLFRDPAAGEPAAAVNLTLAQLMGEEPIPGANKIEEGTGEHKPADLEAASQAAAKAEADELAAERAAADLLANPPAVEGDLAGAEGESELTDEEEAVQFFEAVNTITGEPVEVDYGGDSPMSPEGIAKYTSAVRADEVAKFEAHIKESDPRAYSYFLHRKAGGDDDTFMAVRNSVLPTRTEFDASVDLQSAHYKRSLVSRGLDEDIADMQVTKAIKDNTLEAKAGAAYDADRAAQANQLAAIEQEAEADKAAFEQSCNTVIASINKAVDSGEMKFIIPDTRKAGFKAFVRDSLRMEDGKFYAVQEVGDNIKNVLESLYFQHIKGDLTSLVEKRAGTKTVQRLKLGVQSAKSSGGKGSEPFKQAGGYVSLGDI